MNHPEGRVPAYRHAEEAQTAVREWPTWEGHLEREARAHRTLSAMGTVAEQIEEKTVRLLRTPHPGGGTGKIRAWAGDLREGLWGVAALVEHARILPEPGAPWPTEARDLTRKGKAVKRVLESLAKRLGQATVARPLHGGNGWVMEVGEELWVHWYQRTYKDVEEEVMRTGDGKFGGTGVANATIRLNDAKLRACWAVQEMRGKVDEDALTDAGVLWDESLAGAGWRKGRHIVARYVPDPGHRGEALWLELDPADGRVVGCGTRAEVVDREGPEQGANGWPRMAAGVKPDRAWREGKRLKALIHDRRGQCALITTPDEGRHREDGSWLIQLVKREAEVGRVVRRLSKMHPAYRWLRTRAGVVVTWEGLRRFGGGPEGGLRRRQRCDRLPVLQCGLTERHGRFAELLGISGGGAQEGAAREVLLEAIDGNRKELPFPGAHDPHIARMANRVTADSRGGHFGARSLQVGLRGTGMDRAKSQAGRWELQPEWARARLAELAERDTTDASQAVQAAVEMVDSVWAGWKMGQAPKKVAERVLEIAWAREARVHYHPWSTDCGGRFGMGQWLGVQDLLRTLGEDLLGAVDPTREAQAVVKVWEALSKGDPAEVYSRIGRWNALMHGPAYRRARRVVRGRWIAPARFEDAPTMERLDPEIMRGVEIIRDGTRLAEEGEWMGHCIHSWEDNTVMRGYVHVHLHEGLGRATATLHPTGVGQEDPVRWRVYDVRGPGNKEPAEEFTRKAQRLRDALNALEEEEQEALAPLWAAREARLRVVARDRKEARRASVDDAQEQEKRRRMAKALAEEVYGTWKPALPAEVLAWATRER